MRKAVAVASFPLIFLRVAIAAGLSDPGIQPDRPIRVVERLGVNTSNSQRYIAYRKCENDGVREILELLKQSQTEEMWAFLPQDQASSSCQWHEVGRNERTGTDEAYVDIDWAYLETLMAGSRAVHLYHFHPLSFFEYARSSPSDRGDKSHRQAIVADLKFSMPSPADIYFMMEITSRFHQRHPEGGDIRNRVVTPYGVVDYALTDSGLFKYESDKDARTQGLYIKYVAASALDDESIEAIVAEYPDDLARSMHRLVEILNTEYLRIEFSPFTKN